MSSPAPFKALPHADDANVLASAGSKTFTLRFVSGNTNEDGTPEMVNVTMSWACLKEIARATGELAKVAPDGVVPFDILIGVKELLKA